MLRSLLFSSYLEKNENVKRFFYYHHGETTLKLIEGIQVFLIFLLEGTILTSLFLKILDLVLAISLIIIIFSGIVSFPRVIYGLKYKQEALFIKQVGLIVLYEFTIILETTGSIYDAVNLVMQGDYPYYSLTFRRALLKASFGHNLVESVKIELQEMPFQEITLHFIQLLETWTSSKSLINQFKHDIKDSLQKELSEKNRYVSTYSAFYMAMASIIPPIISILLILNGLFFPIIWIIFCLYMVLLIFGSPFKIIYILADNWGLNPQKRRIHIKISEILSSLKDSMNNRMSFEIALLDVMKRIDNKNQSIIQLKEDIATGLSFSHQKIKKTVQAFFTNKVFHFLKMYYRFIRYDETNATRVINGIIKGARDIESGISDVIESIKAERMRFLLTIVISLLVMGILTNLIDIFKLITFLSQGEGSIRSITTNSGNFSSKILRSQQVIGEQIVMAIYALISSLFVNFYHSSVGNEFVNPLNKGNRGKMQIFFKRWLLRAYLKIKNVFSIYAFYCIGYLLSGLFIGIIF